MNKSHERIALDVFEVVSFIRTQNIMEVHLSVGQPLVVLHKLASSQRKNDGHISNMVARAQVSGNDLRSQLHTLLHSVLFLGLCCYSTEDGCRCSSPRVS